MKGKLIAILILYCAPTLAQDVDPLTGRLNFSIPLFDLDYGGIQLPISLNHDGAGQQLDAPDNDAGLGWGIPHYAVFRQLRGLPDDFKGLGTQRGWLYSNVAQTVNGFTSSSDNNLAICSDEVADYNFIDSLATNAHDTEPDMFSFNAPGLSGQFVFGTDGIPKLLPYQDLKITVNKVNGVIGSFVIQTNTGAIYRFSNKENHTRIYKKYKTDTAPQIFTTDYNLYQQSVTYGSTWYLSSIETLASDVMANFTYTALPSRISGSFYTTIDSLNKVDTLYYIQDQNAAIVLSQVKLGNSTIKITRTDRLINKMELEESGYGEKKAFSFIYNTITDEKVARHVLAEIKQERECVPAPPYKFAYGTTQPAWSKGLGQDYWGYYTSSAPKNIPALYFYSALTGAARFRVAPISGQTATATLNGDNRTPSAPGNALLREIRYPTGGRIQITYGQATYYDSIAGGEVAGGGSRVTSIVRIGDDQTFGVTVTTNGSQGKVYKDEQVGNQTLPINTITTTYEYKLANGSSSGRLTYPAMFGFTTGNHIVRSQDHLGAERGEVIYSRTTVRTAGQGSKVYEYTIAGVYPSVSQGDWKATVTKIARKPLTACNASGDLKNGPYTFPFPPNTEYGYRRALLKRVSNYAEDNTLVSKQETSYTKSNQTTVVVKGIRYEKIGNTYHFGVYSIPTNTAMLVSSQVDLSASETNPSDTAKVVSSYSYLPNSLPSLVVKSYPDGTIQKQRFKYASNFAITAGYGPEEEALRNAVASFRHGLPVETINSQTLPAGTETTTSASLTLYKIWSDGFIRPSEVRTYRPGTFSETTLQAVGSTQQLVIDSDYKIASTIEGYNSHGYPIGKTNDRREITGFHYPTAYGTPLVTINQAHAAEVAFEGFEWNTGRGLTASTTGTAKIQPGWTGQYALQLFSTGLLTSAATITKNSSVYRIACNATAAQATTLTVNVKNGTTTVATTTLSYPATGTSVGQWGYLEGNISLATAPAAFSLEVKSNATITVDDFLFIPSMADASLTTFKPLTGVTSITDARGNSATYTYDALGRRINTFDRYRNLIEYKEYQNQRDAKPTLKGTFVVSGLLQVDNPVNFIALDTLCSQQFTLSYSWKVDGVAAGANYTLPKTFTTPGTHYVELTVTPSDPAFAAKTYGESFCVMPPEILTFNILTSAATYYKCNGNLITFGAANIMANCGSPEMHYVWYITYDNIPFDNIGGWAPMKNYMNSSTYQDGPTITINAPPKSFSVRCDITVDCNNVGQDCITGTKGTIISKVLFIPYVDNSPCP